LAPFINWHDRVLAAISQGYYETTAQATAGSATPTFSQSVYGVALLEISPG
jgi:hypothetical protein